MLRYNVVLNKNVNKWRINMITVAFLKAQKIEAMKTKNKAMSNVVSGVLGELQTQSMKEEGLVIEKDGKKVPATESEFIENNIGKLLKNITNAIEVFEKRGDKERKEQAEAELKYIQTAFFPPLSTEELQVLVTEQKSNGVAMRDFMSFMSANYQGRYNGKEVAQLFQKS